MKYLSIDLETVGLYPREPKGILMISMVVEDTDKKTELSDLAHFSCLLDHGATIEGPCGVIAMAMNTWILAALAIHKAGKNKGENSMPSVLKDLGVPSKTIDRAQKALENYPVLTMEEMIKEALCFIDKHFGENSSVTVAGKNVASFDIPFLPKEISKRFKHRSIDPGSIFINWKEDKAPILK